MNANGNTPALIPIERELRERLIWFIRLRWMAAAAICLGAWAATTWVGVKLSPIPMYGVGVGVACYNGLFYAFWCGIKQRTIRSGGYRRFVYVQIGMDWVALAFLVHASGGIQSPAALAFTFHLIIGAILLSTRACYLQAGIATALLGILGFAESFEIWMPSNIGHVLIFNDFYWWMTLAGIFLISTFLTTSITSQLREKERDLFMSERALDRAYLNLKALSEEKTWFVRTIIHQLRAPLATIQSLLDAMPYAGSLPTKQAELIERCQIRIQEPLDLIQDLLKLASVQGPMPEQKPEAVVLFACLEGVMETIWEQAQVKGVHMDVKVQGKTPVVCAHPDDIRHIFSNLLDNAVKYTPAGGRVTLCVVTQEDRVEATISDTGIGISEADQEHVFEGFYRAESAKVLGELGTGLGLAIVKQLVERWGGQIKVTSVLEKGSHFSVVLPTHL